MPEFDNKKNLLVTMADAGFLKQAKQLFSSVYHNAGWQGDYLLITNNLPDEDRAWFEDRGIIVFDKPFLSNSPLNSDCPAIHLSKLYLFSSYFKKWQKIIFLDADIIVRGSLDRLLQVKKISAAWGMPMHFKDELYFGNEAARDDFLLRYRHLRLGRKIFSSGVIAIDSDIISDQTLPELLALYEKEREFLLFNEESLLNLYFYKQWERLPLFYNFLPYFLRDEYKLKIGPWPNFIMHFACRPYRP